LTIHDLSRVENQTISDFVRSCGDHLAGRVLDFGCGKQPYRQIIEDAGGEYHGYDRRGFGGNVSGRDIGKLAGEYDAIVCTQVLAYVHEVGECLFDLQDVLRDGGRLILTYPAAWPVIRDELWHFTKLGMDALLEQAGFTVERHELRHGIDFDGFSVPMGYGALARA
jgi:SAM-dependent methyltransferase